MCLVHSMFGSCIGFLLLKLNKLTETKLMCFSSDNRSRKASLSMEMCCFIGIFMAAYLTAERDGYIGYICFCPHI
jgi:hypothetical protein